MYYYYSNRYRLLHSITLIGTENFRLKLVLYLTIFPTHNFAFRQEVFHLSSLSSILIWFRELFFLYWRDLEALESCCYYYHHCQVYLNHSVIGVFLLHFRILFAVIFSVALHVSLVPTTLSFFYSILLFCTSFFNSTTMIFPLLLQTIFILY